MSSASEEAIRAVEQAGGTVTCAHFTRLSLRALLKPVAYSLLPQRPRPPPRLMDFYLDRSKAGYLSPEIQRRNLALFGHVTSEVAMREEHARFMRLRMKMLKSAPQQELA